MLTREMKDSGVEWIGNIPENWKTMRLKNALFRRKEIVSEYKGESILSLTMNGVVVRDLDNPKGKMPVSFDGYQSISKGNIITCLFDIDVTPRCVGIANEDGLTSPAYTQYKVNNRFDVEFVYYYLLMLDNDKILVPITKSLRNTIKSEDLLNLKFSFPNIEQQRRIISYIKDSTLKIDAIIHETQRSIEELKKYKQALITEIVTKGLDKNVETRDSEIEWIGKIPTSWRLTKMSRLFEIKKVVANSLDYEVLSVTQQGLRVKNINQNEGQMAADYSKYQIVDPEDFVMNHMDLLTGWIDVAKQVGVTSPDYRVFRAKNTEVIDNEFFLYIFQICYLNRIFYGLGQGVSNLGRWRLQTDKFLNFYLPLPPKKEQVELTQFLHQKIVKIDSLIKEKQEIISEYEQYKKSLIYEYVTGKKEV